MIAGFGLLCRAPGGRRWYVLEGRFVETIEGNDGNYRFAERLRSGRSDSILTGVVVCMRRCACTCSCARVFVCLRARK